MWIGEFSTSTGLAAGAIRFYVRCGLLHPTTGRSGGSRPYLEFSEKDLRRVSAIKGGQALGLSLTEIKSLIDERRAGAGKQRMLQTMIAHREKLARRAMELAALIHYVDAKIAWLSNDATGRLPEPPDFS